MLRLVGRGDTRQSGFSTAAYPCTLAGSLARRTLAVVSKRWTEGAVTVHLKPLDCSSAIDTMWMRRESMSGNPCNFCRGLPDATTSYTRATGPAQERHDLLSCRVGVARANQVYLARPSTRDSRAQSPASGGRSLDGNRSINPHGARSGGPEGARVAGSRHL